MNSSELAIELCKMALMVWGAWHLAEWLITIPIDPE
jgi:hypothetical protein